eukprot:IDg11480t1
MQGNDIALRNVRQTTHLLDFSEGLTDAISDAYSSVALVILDGVNDFVVGL